MTNENDILLFISYLAVLFILALPLGQYMAKVFSQGKTIFDAIFLPLEKLIYRFVGIDEKAEMNWRDYAKNLLWFNLSGLAAVYFIQVLQGGLPFNPEKLPGVESWQLALNTAVSFMTILTGRHIAGKLR